jgi:tetratricopeptide (TPR) repeat protein
MTRTGFSLFDLSTFYLLTFHFPNPMSSPFTPPESNLEVAPPSAIELLWMNHRGALLGGALAVAIAGAVILGVIASRQASRMASEEALAAATDEAAWKGVISKYPGSDAAAAATLLLAASLRDAGKLEESDAIYSRFTETFGRGPLGVSGLLGRASNARIAGKTAEALNDYQQAASGFPQSYGAPFALLSQLRILAQEGRKEETQRILQTLANQYPLSVSAQMAGIRPQAPQGSVQN